MRSNIFKDENHSFIRIHDDNTCAGGSQPTHICGDISSDEEVLSIEDLARQFNVSTKTIFPRTSPNSGMFLWSW